MIRYTNLQSLFHTVYYIYALWHNCHYGRHAVCRLQVINLASSSPSLSFPTMAPQRSLTSSHCSMRPAARYPCFQLFADVTSLLNFLFRYRSRFTFLLLCYCFSAFLFYRFLLNHGFLLLRLNRPITSVTDQSHRSRTTHIGH